MENTARIIGYLIIAAVILGIPALWVVSLIYLHPATTILLSGVVIIEWFAVAAGLQMV